MEFRVWYMMNLLLCSLLDPLQGFILLKESCNAFDMLASYVSAAVTNRCSFAEKIGSE
jgi:hypothetical protein